MKGAWVGFPGDICGLGRAIAAAAAAAVVLLACGGAWADRAEKKPSLPVAHSGNVSIYRNKPVAIELSATTSSVQRLEFLIREVPRFGTLSAITPVTGDNRKSRVLYTPDPGATGVLDGFKFTAQVPGEAPSAAAVMEIRILDPVPILAVEAPVQFRKVRVGEVGRAAFVVRNVGQARYRGRIELLSPWVLDRDVLEVEPGAAERVTVEFRPLVPGKVGTRLQLQAGADGAAVGIYGEAVAPFTVSPGMAELSADVGGGARRAKLTLENTTAEPMVVSLHAPIDPENPSSRLQFPGKVEISAEGKAEAELFLPAEDLGAIDEVLTLSSKLYSVEVRVVSKALPARLMVVDPPAETGWNFGKVVAGEAAGEKKFVLANLGGVPVVATVEVAPPFAVEGAVRNLEVGGGQRVEVTVRPETRNAGVFASDLVLEWAEGRLAIPLSIEIGLTEADAKPEVAAGTGAAPSAPAPVAGGGNGGARGTGGGGGSAESAEAPGGVSSLTERSSADVLFDAYAAHYGLPLSGEPYYAKLKSVREVKLVKGDHRSVDLSWERAGSAIESYAVEMSQMFRDVNNGGRVVKRWIPWKGEIKRLEDVGNAMVVRLEPMIPGTEYEIRVVARDAKGRQALPSEPIVLLTGIPESLWAKVLRWMMVPVGLILLFVGYRLVQAYRGRSERGKVYAGAGEHGGIRGALEGLRAAIFR